MMSEEQLKQRHRDEFEAAQRMADQRSAFSVVYPSPIYIPRHHTKMTYRGQQRAAKKRRRRR
jgi:hypothetical protein